MDLKKKKLILAVFISILMITSIAGLINLPENQNSTIKKIYNGIEFNYINNKWIALVNNLQIPLSFDPEILGSQNITSVNELNSAQKIYLSNNQNLTNNIYQEVSIFTQLSSSKIINSCYEDSEACKKLPVKTCNDAKDLNKVIIIKKENKTNIRYLNNCLEIIGNEIEIVKFIDQLILDLLIKQYGK